MTKRLPVLLALSLALSAGAVPTLAQERPQKPEKTDAPLRGPAVRNNRPPALEDRFTQGRPDGRGAMAQRGMPLREFHRVLESMRGEEAPAEIRLSAEQDGKIREIMEDFRRQQRSPGAQGDRPPREGQRRPQQRGQEPMQEERPRERGMPPADRPQSGDRPQPGARPQPAARPQDVQTRVWAVLNEKQQKHVMGEMEKVRKEMEERRGEEMLQRRMQERQEGDAARPGSPEDRAGGADRGPERLRRIAERMRELPPEERERILKMLEAELEKAEKR